MLLEELDSEIPQADVPLMTTAYEFGQGGNGLRCLHGFPKFATFVRHPSHGRSIVAVTHL